MSVSDLTYCDTVYNDGRNMCQLPEGHGGDHGDPPTNYDPAAEYRVKASAMLDEARSHTERIRSQPSIEEAKARLLIDAAGVSIRIADHYQREHTEPQVPA